MTTMYQVTANCVVIVACLFLGPMHAGCSSVQVVRLTSETFPPRSVNEVSILSREPGTAHVNIAELSETSSSDVQALQRHIVKKAAQLGADAVVFFPSVTHIEQRVDYQPAYSPWGYGPYYYGPGPYGYWGPWGYRYGPWGPAWGYGSYMAVPYAVRVTTVKGTAIKYL